MARARRSLLRHILSEDVGTKDWTTEALIPRSARGKGRIVSRNSGVVAGLPLVREIYGAVDRRIRVAFRKKEGAWIRRGEVVATVHGPMRSLLTGERVALNFLSHLSGIATLTRRFVDKVHAFPVVIMDTRKTTPGLRSQEKYAVRCGGGVNQRLNLGEAVMIKDNHLEALDYDWGHLAKSLRRRPRKQVTVEVDRLSFLARAAELQPDVILLDNMSVRDVRKAVQWVRRRGKKILLEASGGITLASVRDYARAGVDRISIGALTHSPPHLDFSFEISRA
jgi:nicotinate-nucleotide pyrophosphorylase (carboxylating)